MMDKVNSRFDEISPITGNQCVLVEPVDIDGAKLEYKLCMESGFQTYPEIWNKDHPASVELAEQSIPSYMREIKFIDDLGVTWLPINIIDDISLFLIKNEIGELIWAIFKKPQTTGAMALVSDAIFNDTPEATFARDDFENAWDFYFSLRDDQPNGQTNSDN